MDDSRVTTIEDIESVADEIRSKAGISGLLKWPLGFIAAIRAILVGDDCNAAAGDIVSGKTAIVNRAKVTGNIPARTGSDVSMDGNVATIPKGNYASTVQKALGTYKAGETYNTSASDQTIASGLYLAGVQTIKGVTTENLESGNIKHGVLVRVGDANGANRIKSVLGTYKGTPKWTEVTSEEYVTGKSIVPYGYQYIELGGTPPQTGDILVSFDAYLQGTTMEFSTFNSLYGASGYKKVIENNKAYIIGTNSKTTGNTWQFSKIDCTWKRVEVED